MKWSGKRLPCLPNCLPNSVPAWLPLGFCRLCWQLPSLCWPGYLRPFNCPSVSLCEKSADFATRSSRRFHELGPTFSIDLLSQVRCCLPERTGGVGVCGGQNTPCAFGSLGEGAIINVVANMLCTRKHKESRVAVARASVTRRQSAFVRASRSTLRPPVFSIVRLINAMPADRLSTGKSQNEILKSKQRMLTCLY